MPYIKQSRKVGIEHPLEIIASALAEKGELTFCVYKLGMEYMKTHGVTFKRQSKHHKVLIDKGSYQVISDAISALDDAAHELRRRFLNDYEDEKIFENGDIE